MTVSYYQVEVQLGNHLRAMPGVPAIAWDATPFTTPRSLWVRPTLLPGAPEPLFVGKLASMTRVGVYRIGVFGPSGSGLRATSELADRIINHFEQSPVLDPLGVNITITSAGRSPAVSEAEFYQIPVSINFSFIS